ncbi:hypothetical protein MJO28_012161 [Puccinia striiformis f. sp. tritici]|uniref:Uncharacterized protein n=1 Tax=Puccinia striiformis f. sp. tritici TaxID=168172 RepID=A0ACC0E130_9BASI|nr:hypothetical protein MJO28_012161 [Puccinia striiformis f. sp. tritici]
MYGYVHNLNLAADLGSGSANYVINLIQAVKCEKEVINGVKSVSDFSGQPREGNGQQENQPTNNNNPKIQQSTKGHRYRKFLQSPLGA